MSAHLETPQPSYPLVEDPAVIERGRGRGKGISQWTLMNWWIRHMNVHGTKKLQTKMTLSSRIVTSLLLLSLVVFSPSCAREDAGGQVPGSSGRAKWLNFDDGLAKAKTEDKPIFLEFYTDWCIYCKKFQRETIQDKDVRQRLSENFAYVRLNAENSADRLNYDGKSFSNVELTQAFGVTSFPSLVFLDSEGKPITMLSGFVPPRQFTAVLDYIHQKCYQTQISFHDFAKKGTCN